MAIHPTAVIHPSVPIDPSNEIGPFVVIEEGVEIGLRNRLIAQCYLDRGLRLGNDNVVFPGASLGAPPQDLGHDPAVPSFVVIGDHNTIREGVTIHRASGENAETVIGNYCFLMANAHVGHNCRLADRVIMANEAGLGGHVEVGERAFLSKGVGCHQFTRVGKLVMFSALSGTNQDVPPFMHVNDRNAKVYGLNLVGLKRAGYDTETRKRLREAHDTLYRKGLLPKEAANELESVDCPAVQELVAFIRESKRGIVSGIRS